MSKMTRRRRAMVGVVLAPLMFASACGDDGSTTAPPAEANSPTGEAAEGCTADRVGGSITIGEFAPTEGLDPVVGGGTGLSSGRVGGAPGAAIYDTLVILNEETGEFVPHLAESISPNDDRSVWTLKLRPDVAFSNGDPFDAEAVVTSIKRHIAEDARSTVQRGLVLVDEFVIVDDLTVEFHLSVPWGYFPMLLATSAGMITNQRVVDERGDDFNLNPVGAGVGPYEVERFLPGETLVLHAKDDYWGGPVCIEELRFVHHQGAGLTFEALKAGEVDVAFLQEAETIALAKQEGYDGLRWMLQGGAAFLMNTGVEGSTSATADVRVRRAVALALDPGLLDERRFAGEGLPTSAIVHPDAPYAPSVDGPSFDPDAARQLVDEIKADTGWDGRVRLLCNEASRAGAIAAQSLLEAVGMQVETTISDTAGLIRGVVVDKDYDLACWGINFTGGDVWFGMSTYGSDSPTNYSGLHDSQMDEALAELRNASGTAEIQEAMGEVQSRWNEVVPTAVYGALETYVAYGDHVHGLLPTTRETFLFHDAFVD